MGSNRGDDAEAPGQARGRHRHRPAPGPLRPRRLPSIHPCPLPSVYHHAVYITPSTSCRLHRAPYTVHPCVQPCPPPNRGLRGADSGGAGQGCRPGAGGCSELSGHTGTGRDAEGLRVSGRWEREGVIGGMERGRQRGRGRRGGTQLWGGEAAGAGAKSIASSLTIVRGESVGAGAEAFTSSARAATASWCVSARALMTWGESSGSIGGE